MGQDVFKQGELAAQLVVDTVTTGAAVTSSVLPTRLVPRGSTGAPSPRFFDVGVRDGV